MSVNPADMIVVTGQYPVSIAHAGSLGKQSGTDRRAVAGHRERPPGSTVGIEQPGEGDLNGAV